MGDKRGGCNSNKNTIFFRRGKVKDMGWDYGIASERAKER